MTECASPPALPSTVPARGVSRRTSEAARLAVILVHYHSPDLVALALAALRADLADAGLEVEWLVVDNGSEPEERELLERLDAVRIDAGGNLGYAGGVNLGVSRSSADLLVLMNPDVLVLPGCLSALIECLSGEAGIAGPRFFWDGERRLLLPPLEIRTRLGELSALLAARSERWARRARRSWRRKARRHWQAREPLPSYALSGGLLALRRSTWEEVGPFDDRFQLFFEETDWLLRAKRKGVPSFYVPAAQAVHIHGQSTLREPRSQEWFEASARRFRRLHYGAWFTRLLELLDRKLPKAAVRTASSPSPSMNDGVDVSRRRADFPLWIEVSPVPTGIPAAGEELAEPPRESWRLPAEIAERLPPGDWLTLIADRSGRESARCVLRSGAGAATVRGAG